MVYVLETEHHELCKTQNQLVEIQGQKAVEMKQQYEILHGSVILLRNYENFLYILEERNRQNAVDSSIFSCLFSTINISRSCFQTSHLHLFRAFGAFFNFFYQVLERLEIVCAKFTRSRFKRILDWWSTNACNSFCSLN